MFISENKGRSHSNR